MLHFDRRGEGPRITFLLHGFMGSGRNLSSLARRWVERDPSRTLVFPDLTGHGESPPLRDPPSLDQLASAVLELAEQAAGHDPVSIVGHSMGGRVALLARILAPERVSAVTLLDISPGPTGQAGNLDPVVQALVRAPDVAADRDVFRAHFADAGLSRGLTDWLLMNLIPADGGGFTWRFSRTALDALQRNSRDLDLWDGVRGPTACIRGGRSPFVSDEDVRRMTAAGVVVHTLVDAGHFLHVDAQSELLDLLVADPAERGEPSL